MILANDKPVNSISGLIITIRGLYAWQSGGGVSTCLPVNAGSGRAWIVVRGSRADRSEPEIAD